MAISLPIHQMALLVLCRMQYTDANKFAASTVKFCPQRAEEFQAKRCKLCDSQATKQHRPTSPQSWKQVITMAICEHEMTMMMKTTKRNPNKQQNWFSQIDCPTHTITTIEYTYCPHQHVILTYLRLHSPVEGGLQILAQEQGPDKFEFVQPPLYLRFDLTGWQTEPYRTAPRSVYYQIVVYFFFACFTIQIKADVTHSEDEEELDEHGSKRKNS